MINAGIISFKTIVLSHQNTEKSVYFENKKNKPLSISLNTKNHIPWNKNNPSIETHLQTDLILTSIKNYRIHD